MTVVGFSSELTVTHSLVSRTLSVAVLEIALLVLARMKMRMKSTTCKDFTKWRVKDKITRRNVQNGNYKTL